MKNKTINRVKTPLKNETVEGLMKKFSELDPKAIVCGADIGASAPVYYTLNICKEVRSASYVTHEGTHALGNIVVMF